MKRCQTCGNLSEDHATFCSSCGAYFASLVSPVAASTVASPYDEPDEVIPFIDNRGRGSTQSIQEEQPAASSRSDVATLQGQSNSVHSESIQTASQVMPASKQANKGMTAVAAALLVVLAFVVMSGSIAGCYFVRVYPAKLSDNATAVVQSILTAQAQGTAEANARLVARFSTTTPETLYTQITAQKPVLDDPLSKQDSADWLETIQSDGSCTFAQGTYQLIAKQGALFCLAVNTNFSDFAYQVKMTIEQGYGAGLIFRSDDLQNKGYIFIVDLDTSYFLEGYANNSFTTLARGNSQYINTGTGQANIVAVIAFHNEIYLYVNGHFLMKVLNSTGTSGRLGVSTLFSGATVASFSDAEVWKL